MRRALVLVSVLAVTLLFTQRAAAEETCACDAARQADESLAEGWPSNDGRASEGAFAGVAADGSLLIDVDPSLLETPDPHTVHGVLPRTEVQPVLWCSHANDPRCAPLAPEDHPTFRALEGAPPALVPTRLSIPRRTPSSDEPEEASRRPAGSRDTGRDVASQLDRPPRV